jgi:hypothetical protein
MISSLYTVFVLITMGWSLWGSWEGPQHPRAEVVSVDDLIEKKTAREFEQEIKTIEDLDLVKQELDKAMKEAEDINRLDIIAELTAKEDLLQAERQSRVTEAPPTKPEEGKSTGIPVEKPSEPTAISPEQAQREAQVSDFFAKKPAVTTVGELRNLVEEINRITDNLQKGKLPDGTTASLSSYEKARLISIIARDFEKMTALEESVSSLLVNRFAADMRTLGSWALAYVPGSSWLPGIEKPWEVLREEGLGTLKSALTQMINEGLSRLDADPRIKEQQLNDAKKFIIEYALDEALLKDVNFRLQQMVIKAPLALDQAERIWRDILSEDPLTRFIIGTGQRGALRKRLALKEGGLTAQDRTFLTQMDRDMEQAARDLVSFTRQRLEALKNSPDINKKYRELEGFYRLITDLDANRDSFSDREKTALSQLGTLQALTDRLRLDVLLDKEIFQENWRSQGDGKPSLFAELYSTILTLDDYRQEISTDKRKQLLEQQKADLSRLLEAVTANPALAKLIATNEAELYDIARFRRDDIVQFLADPPQKTSLALDKQYELYKLIPQDQLSLLKDIYNKSERGRPEDFLGTLKNMREVFEHKQYQKNLLLYDSGRALGTLVTMMVAFRDANILKELISWAQDKQLKSILERIKSGEQQLREELENILKAQAGLLNPQLSVIAPGTDMGTYIASLGVHGLFTFAQLLRGGAYVYGGGAVVSLLPWFANPKQAIELGVYAGTLYGVAAAFEGLAKTLSILDIEELKRFIESGKPLTVSERITTMIGKARRAGISFKATVNTFLTNWLNSLKYGIDSIKTRLPKTTQEFNKAYNDYLTFLGLDPQRGASDAVLQSAVARKKRAIAALGKAEQNKAQTQLDLLAKNMLDAQRRYVATYQEYITLIYDKVLAAKEFIAEAPETFTNLEDATKWVNDKLVLLADFNEGLTAMGANLKQVVNNTPLAPLQETIAKTLEDMTTFYQQETVNGIDKAVSLLKS